MTEEISPTEDIDETYEVDTLRIKRVNAERLWFAGFRDDGEELHFNALCDDGLTVHTWHYFPESVQNQMETIKIDAAARDTSECPDCGGELTTVETDFGMPIECEDCGERYEIDRVEFLRRYQRAHDNNE